MIVINIILLAILAGLYLITLRRPAVEPGDLDKKEHKLYFLYPMTEVILSIAGVHKYLQPKSEVTDSIKALKLTTRPEQLQRLYLNQKIALMIVVIALFSIISILSEVSSPAELLRDGRYINRPEQGKGSKEVELDVALRSSDETSQEGDHTVSRRITLEVEERIYSMEEITELFEKGKEYLSEHVLGENDNAENVRDRLSFIEAIPNTGIAVDWIPEDRKLILGDGTVKNEELTEAVKTTVIAVLSYEEQETSLSLSFRVVPKVLSEEEQLNSRLEAELYEAQTNSRREGKITLPKQLDEYSLRWSEYRSSDGLTILIFGIMTAFILWYLLDMELKHRMKLRRDQLLMDYPEVINKFTLLVNAGMTVRQAWCKVAEDYRIKRLQGTVPLHYAYEEMLTTVHELMLGVAEGSAYEQYGRRLGLIPYIKFSSLISQNRKKGNRGFTEMLRQEALEAFEDRKEIAKRLGEEAGTKLLAPMMFLLIIVFLIILIPAFMAFQI